MSRFYFQICDGFVPRSKTFAKENVTYYIIFASVMLEVLAPLPAIAARKIMSVCSTKKVRTLSPTKSILLVWRRQLLN